MVEANLSADEVAQFLEAVPSLKVSAALATAYAAGRRALETTGVKIFDIDRDRMLIQVHHSKGGKDRTVMLPPQTEDYQDEPGRFRFVANCELYNET